MEFYASGSGIELQALNLMLWSPPNSKYSTDCSGQARLFIRASTIEGQQSKKRYNLRSEKRFQTAQSKEGKRYSLAFPRIATISSLTLQSQPATPTAQVLTYKRAARKTALAPYASEFLSGCCPGSQGYGWTDRNYFSEPSHRANSCLQFSLRFKMNS